MRTVALFCFGLVVAVNAKIETTAKPLYVPASGFWEGNDGRWSTFNVQIGRPAQVVRLLPGTSATAANQVWAVLNEGCTQANPDLDLKDCISSRGGVFKSNASTSWTTARLENGGLYEIDLFEESKLGLSANAYFGFDDVSFGVPGSGVPTLSDQLVAGFATNDFFLGTLPLSPISQNFTSYTTKSIPSVLGTLRNSSIAPSTTWAYTAGAVYKDPPVFGSVTFGGYDANRIDLRYNSVSVPFWTDPSRDLLLGLQSITYDTLGSSPLLTDGIYVFLDSMVAQMWLPLPVCQAFESAFGIEWDNVTELYTVSEATHTKLLAQNPTFEFTVGVTKEPQGNGITSIKIPYAAFDLNVSTPYYNDSRRYFPLKRAQNDTQYTLGRAFLQEAYVIADYDRRNFTIGQALFPTTEDVKAILPPGEMVDRPGSKTGLSKGAIAGIAVGVVVLIAAILVCIWLWWRKKQQRARQQKYILTTPDEKPIQDEDDANKTSASELEPQDMRELRGNDWYPELRGDERHPELSSSKTHDRSELGGHVNDGKYELPAGGERYELSAGRDAAAELEAKR
ncbi:unnamed protein product [Zymoseptoria tritici ST99CH_1A5]|uniref:Peptidase A1 domain-containing protein n=1 Tax=Zymoseptoria tritici ST99CH_1A5 TaxID=1276529 RepID=A0A1Y6M092_ZYMTR|nr:unnamed protein product [Zymoseptoria tritici ST99CH_1A5]